MGVYVLRNETLSGSGGIVGQIDRTEFGSTAIPPETPFHIGESWGSCSITGAGSFSFVKYRSASGTDPNKNYDLGWSVTVTDPFGNSTTDTDYTTYSPRPIQDIRIDSTGTWSASIDCELCLEVTDPTIPSGTGSSAVNYNPDPPHGRTYRLFFRRRNGGSWSISASLGGASVSLSGTWSNSSEIGIPDSIISTVEASATQEVDDAPFEIDGEISGTWRGALIAETRSASGSHGSAYAGNTVGVSVTAKALSDPIADSGNAYATRSLAVPLTFDLDAQLRAMEVAYPDQLTLEYQRAGTTVDVTATGSYGDTGRTYRSESSEVWVKGNGTTEDSDTYSHPSNWGAISIGIKSSSATTNNEPTTDLKLLLKDRKMSALSIETPEKSANLTGTDTALGGSPWGVQRSYTGLSPAWQGLMGWRYLEVIIAETGGASSGASVTIKIGSKSWTKDKDGTALTAPGSGNSRTWYIDLCSPSSESATTDTCDTTYPYDGDWSITGDEDDYYRTGTGPYSGVNRAETIRIEVGSSRTFTITSIKGWRTVASTVYGTNLPAHAAWVEQRPATVVSEADTTTYHKVRQSYEVDLEGRLIAAEWSDTQWDTTVGGASGVYTHTLYQQSIKWLADRINAAVLCPGWTSTIVAPVSGTGSQEWYNRDREMHGLLGGGYYWTGPASTGSWTSGIDIAQRTSGGGAQTLAWQGGFTELTNCPGGVGDVFQHDGSATTGTLVLKAAKVLRTQGVGMALETSGLPGVSKTFTLTQTTAKGTGTSDANGYAQTGSPYGNGNGGDITLDFGADTGTYAAKARKRRHFRSRVVETGGGGIRLCISPTDRLTRGYYDGTPSKVVLGFAQTPVAGDWVDYETTLQAEDFWIDYSATGSTVLILTYVDGSDIKRVTTADEGETFSVATTIITSAKHPAFVISPTGVEYHFGWATGGIIKTRVFDAQGTEMVATTNVVASGADDDQLAVEWRDGWVVLAYVASGNIQTVKSQDGTTYS